MTISTKLKKLNRPEIWALITLIALMLTGYLLPISEAGEYGPTYTWNPSATNWTLNFSFTLTADMESNSTHVELSNITGWDTTYLLVGSDGNISTYSDYNHNITLTNYSNDYTKMSLILNGNTSINISDMDPNTEYNIFHDGELNTTVTSDSNDYLFFHDTYSGTYIINQTSEEEETYKPPSPTNLQNTTGYTWINWTWDSGTGNETDSYNVSIDGVWHNATTNEYYNATGLAEGSTHSIEVYAYNNSGGGTLSDNSVTDSVTTDESDENGGNGGGEVNQAPTADYSYSIDDKTVDFTDESTDSDGTISDWLWDFGDGATSTAQNPSHTYSDYDSYTVKLTVTDDDGATDSITKTIETEPPPSPDFKIINYEPSVTDYYSTKNSNVTFTIWLNKTADNVTWYMNGSELKTEYNINTSSYNNNSPSVGVYKIYVLAQNNSDYAGRTWYWHVTNSTFLSFGNVEEEVGSGFHNILGNLALMTVAVFLVLGLLCYGFKLNVKESLVVFLPVVSATTHVSIAWAPLWIKAAFVIGVALIWYMAYTRITREQYGV